jgi:hypothetical protein
MARSKLASSCFRAETEISMTLVLIRNALALALLGCVSATHAKVIFTESGTEALVDGVRASTADTHVFTIDAPGLYEATIVDLASRDDSGFSDPFSLLKLAVVQLGPSGGFYGQAGLPPASASFTFPVANPGSFAALVKAAAGCDAFGFYEINIAQIGPIPEPKTWLLMLIGVVLLGSLRIRWRQGVGLAAGES